MANTLLIAFSSVAPGAEPEAFTTWYGGTHVPEVRAAIPSITNVTRYQLTDPQSGEPLNRYVAIYEIDEADVAKAAGQLFAAGAGFTQTDTMDREIDPPVLHWAANSGFGAE